MKEKKIYEKTWFIIVMLIFVAPVGIFLLWKQQKLKVVPRTIVSVFFGIIFLAAIFSPKGDTDSMEVAKVGSTTEPTEKPTKESTKKSTKKEDKKEKPKPTEKPIKVTVDKLLGDYDNNEIKADKQYKEKTAEITGKVNDISVTFGVTSISLESTDEMSFTTVHATVEDEKEIEKVGEINKGDEITITGLIKGYTAGLYVDVEKAYIK